MTVSLEVEQIANVVYVGIFVSGALHDGEHTRLTVCGLVAGLHAFCINLVRRHEKPLLGNKMHCFGNVAYAFATEENT